jgi:hypothetical protein
LVQESGTPCCNILAYSQRVKKLTPNETNSKLV